MNALLQAARLGVACVTMALLFLFFLAPAFLLLATWAAVNALWAIARQDKMIRDSFDGRNHWTKLSVATLLTLATALALALPSKPPSGLVILSWNYPPADLLNNPNLSFTVYHATNLATPLTNWLVMTNLLAATVPGTNFAGADPALSNMFIVVTITPGPHFFVLTASNEWGEGNFSRVALMGSLPRSDEDFSAKRGD